MNEPTPLGQRLWRILVVVLSIEAIATAAVVVFLIVEQFIAQPMSRLSSLALLGTTIVALALIVAILVGAFRRGSWVRGAAVTWQILQLAAAWTIVQGDMATYIGWGLTALSVVGFIAAVHPATRTALHSRGD